MTRLTKFGIRVFVTVLLSLLVITNIFAQPNAYDELDILFLVDQSGSMGGADFGSNVAPTDPKLLRFESVQFALRTLSQYKSVVPADIDFQMAVINFGDVTEVTLDWTLIEGNSPEWTQRMQELTQSLSVDQFGRRNLGNTNFIDAINTASNLFDSLPNDGKKRLKVIVITTDGAPCAPTRPEWIDSECATPSDMSTHMDTLELVVNQEFATDARLYVLGIDENNDFWQTYETTWNRIVDRRGTSERIQTSDDISPAFLRILTELVKSFRGTSGSGGAESIIGQRVSIENREAHINVPPYYQTLRITLFKVDPSIDTQIQNPNGIILTETSPNVNVIGKNESIEVWEISNPIPGTWNIFLNGEDDLLDVYLDLITVNHSITVPIDPQIMFLPVDIALQINGVNDQPLPVYTDPKYALQATLSVQTPSGNTETFDFNLQSGNNNQYIATYIPTEPGTHTVNIQAKTKDTNNTELLIIDQSNVATIDVNPVQLAVTGIPTNDLLVSEDVTLTASLIDDLGKQITIQGVNIRAVVKDQSDIQWANVPLIPTNTSGTEFTETISMVDPGQYRIEVIAEIIKDTAPTQIGSQMSGLFTVEPANFLLIEDVTPIDGAISYLEEGSFPLVFTYEPNPLVVSFIIIEENDGMRVNLADYVDNGNPITIQVIAESDQTDYAQGQLLTMLPDDVGHYQLVLPDLPQGTYTVQVTSDPDVQLKNSTLFATRTRSFSHRIQRETNPQYLISIGLTILVFLLFILAVAVFVLHNRRLRVNPIKGTLTILQENYIERDTIQLQFFNLGGYKRNRITLKKLTSVISPFGIKKFVVLSDSAKDVVRVEIHYANGKKFDRKRLAPGQPVMLGSDSENDYFIVKDYEDL